MSQDFPDANFDHSASSSTNTKRRKLLIEQLEDRVLFDAVPVAPVETATAEADAMVFMESSTTETVAQDVDQKTEQQSTNQVVFVDKSVEGFEDIVAEFVDGRELEVFFINDGSAGLKQIADHLDGRTDLNAIHIISHGDDAQLFLGDSAVTSEDLSGKFADELQTIGKSLSESGDILIYGCDLAANESGEQFIHQFSEITQADVAASDDLTGSSALGGDWDLEKQTGSIETQSLNSSSYDGILLETDAGFVVGTATFGAMNEVEVTPLSEEGVSSRMYANAATANGGATVIDLQLTLVDTYDEFGNLTTGTANQVPVTFSDFAGGPVLLARNIGTSVSGFEGHVAHIMVEFFDASNGNPLSVVGDFTFKDIDYEAPTANGSGSEAVNVVSDQMQSYSISSSPASSLEIVQNANETTTFTNTTDRGGEADQERWVSIQFYDMPQLNLRFTARNANTGYGLSTANFSATPLTFYQPVANDDNFSTTENTSISGNVIADDNGNGIDFDPDGDSLTVAQVDGESGNVGATISGSAGGSFTIQSNGAFNFDPGSDFEHLALGETAVTSVTYQVTDGTGLYNSATVTVTVVGTNDTPTTIGTIANQSNNDNQTITPLDVSGYFSDIDATDSITYDAGATLPPGLVIDSVTGIISGTIDNSASVGAPYTVVITANDGNGGTITQSFTWVVNNPGPTAVDNTAAVKEDTSPADSGNVILDDDGAGADSDPDNDLLSVNAVNGSAANVGVAVSGLYGSLQLNANGAYVYTLDDNNPTVTALDNGDSLAESFTYTISDGEGGTASATLTISIDGTNDAPVVGSTIPGQANADAETIPAFDVSGFFGDAEGDTLTFSASNLPSGLSIDPATGLISGTIDNNASQGGSGGVYTVVVRATDDNGDFVNTSFSWAVSNPGPTATDNTANVTEDSALTDSGNLISDNDGNGIDTDPDGDTLTVGAVEGAAGNVGISTNGTYGSILVNANGSYVYTLDNNHAAVSALDLGESLTEVFTYMLTDGDGGTSTANITITINGTNDAPLVAGSIPSQTNNDAETVSALDVSGYFTDPDGDTLTYGASGLPAGLVLDPVTGLISGTVDNSASQGGVGGVYSIVVTATDDNGANITTTFQWTITNPGPTANDNSASVTEDTSLVDSGNVIDDHDGFGIDTDPDADTLTVSAFNGSAANVGVLVSGTFGDIVLNSDGSYTYTLDNNSPAVSMLDTGETVTDTFTYTISDGEGGTSTAMLTVTVNGTNDSPVIGATIPNQTADDAESIATLDVTGYFSDPDGDTLTYGASNLPSGLAIDPLTGLITGTIDNSASQGGTAGVYTVSVTATDDNGQSVTTSFDWTIINPGPTASDNAASVTEDSALSDSGNVITDNDGSGVDLDPDGDLLVVDAVDGVSANVGLAIAGSYGNVVINSDGSYTYTLDNANPIVSGLDNGESVVDTFTYTISDGEGGTATASLTVTINGSNDAPLVGGTIPSQSNNDSDAIATFDVTPYFSDPDGDALTYAATNLPAGLIIDPSTGLITGTIDNSASQGGTAGTYTVSVTATDDNGQSVTTSFDWAVTNPGPSATPNSAAVTEDTLLTDSGNVISDNDGNGVDSDPDGDVLSVGAVDGLTGNVGVSTSGSYGTIVINTDGSYAYSLDNNNPAVSSLDNGETLTETFSYTLTDGEGGTSTANITITINGSNDAPTIVGSIADQSNSDAETITALDVGSFFSDVDGDALTYSASGLPTGLSLDPSTGLITGTIDNSASQGGTAGVYTVSVTATDDNGQSVMTSFDWTIGNPGPTATDNLASVTEDSALSDSGNVISDDDGSGVDFDPDGDLLTISAVSGAAGNVGVSTTGTYGSIVINNDGSYAYTLDNNNAAVSSLDNGETLSETFSYTLTDSEGGVSTASVTVTINGTNDAPVTGSPIPAQANDDAESVSLSVAGYFSDPDGDALAYSATNLPAGLSIDPITGMIFGTIDSSASQSGIGGVYTVSVTATDDNGEFVTTTFDWTIGNPAPTATENAASVTANTVLSDSGNVISDNDGDGVDADPDGDALIVNSFNGSAANVGISVAGSYGDILLNSDGGYVYTLDNSNPAVQALTSTDSLTDTFTYTVSDGEGGTSTATLTVTVNGANDAPIVGGTIPNQVNDDAESIAALNVAPFFSDPDGDTLTYSSANLPAGLSLDPITGIVTGTIDPDASQGGLAGSYSVVFTATDPTGESVSTTFTWTVNNPAPEANDNSASVTEDTALVAVGNVLSDDDGSGVDSDPDGDLLTVSRVDGSDANVGISTGGLYGSVLINSDGSYTYTLDNTNPAVSTLDDGESLTESFTYSISDGEGGTSTANLIMTIHGANDAPIVGGTIPNQTNQDAELVSPLDVTPFFSDPDGDSLNYTASNLPAGLTIDSSSGLISGTIDPAASQGGIAGSYSVSVTATDDNGESVTTTFTWAVANPGPVAVDDSDLTTQSSLATGNVITNDSDPDGDLITVNAVEGLAGNIGSPVTGSNGGLFSVDSDGSYQFDPNGDFDILAVGETAVTQITYEITDNQGGSATATLTVTVNGENDDPSGVGTIPAQTNQDADTIAPLDVSGFFADLDSTDVLSFSATGLPLGLSIDSAGVISGTIDNSASLSGPYAVTITVTDGNGGTADQVFAWNVSNPGPIANDDFDSTTENSTLAGDVFNNDSDPDGDTVQVSSVNGVTGNVGVNIAGSNGGQFRINSDGSFSFDPGTDFDNLAVGEFAATDVTYTISDGEGGTDTATLSITVNGLNDDPVGASSIPAQSSVDGETIGSLDVSGFFSDVDGSDVLSFTAVGLPTGLSISGAGVISGTIDNSASLSGPFAVIVTANDGNGASIDQAFVWSVANPAPVASDNTADVTENVSLTDSGNVIGDDDGFGIDVDPDGDLLQVNSVAGSAASVGVTITGSYGDIVINSDGSYTYTLDNSNPAVTALDTGDLLAESFSYSVSDGEGGSSSATLSITIHGDDSDPIVGGTIPDQANSDSDIVAALDLSSFFSDPEGLALTFTASDLPPGLSIDPSTGVVSGTLDSSASAGGTSGVYSVSVTATDGGGQSVSTTFDWTVTNPAPNANDDGFAVDEDGVLSTTVAGNDFDSDADVLAFTQVSSTSDGTLTFNLDGSFTYTPDADFYGLDSFDYQITDADGAVSTATVTITVSPINDNPINVTPIADQSNLDSDVVSLDVAGNFSDIDGDALAFSATGLPTGLTMNSAGTISGTIGSSASASGPFTVVVTVSDGNGGSVTDTFTWSVSNPAPIANGDAITTSEDTPVSGTVVSNDGDPDGDSLTYALTSGPSNGVVVFNSDGTFDYSPDPDFHGPDSFDYQVIDVDGSVDTATVDVTVNSVNDPPVVNTNIPDQSDNDNDVIVFNVAGNFTDVEGDALTFSATGLPPGLAIDVAGNISGTIDSSASVGGPYAVVISANDGHGGTVTDTFMWSVVNPGPTANDDGFTTSEDVPVTGSVATNDVDPDGDALVYTLVSSPANGNVVFNNDGSFTYTPAADIFGVDTFDYQITDADGATSTATVSISVNPVNDGPVVDTPIADQSSFDSDSINIDISGNFDDVDGDPLTLSVTGLPPGLTMDASGHITGIIDSSASASGPYTVIVTAVDGNGGSTTDTFTWSVFNPAPNTVNDSVTTAEDVAVSGNVATNDSDPDGDTTTFNKLTDPANGTVVFNNDGTFVYTPNLDFTGVDTFDYEMVDADGASTTGRVTVVVGDVNDPPIVTSPVPDQTNLDRDSVSLDVSGSFSDVEGDTLTFTATGLPTGLVITPGGMITGTIDNSASLGGPYAVIVTADDGNGGTATDTFTWTVNNPSPVATNNSVSLTEDAATTGVGNLISDDDGNGVDSDPDGDTISIVAVDGSAADVGVTVNGTYGTIQILADGSYVYTIDNNHPDVNQLDVGETLTESFTYTLSDGEGGSGSATLTVTIEGANDAPDTTGTISDQSNVDSEFVSLNLTTVFSDDDGDSLTYFVSGLPSGLTLNPSTGIVAGTIDSSASQGGPTGDGNYTVTVTATDDNGESVTTTFGWVVTNPVPNAQNDSYSISEDGNLVADVGTNDSDLDGDLLTYTLLSGPGNGSVVFNTDGTFSYTPNPDFFGTETFDYEMCDADGACTTATVTIAINSVNDAPVIDTTLPDLNNEDSESVAVDVSVNFADVDGDALTFSAVGLPAGLTINPAGIITGTIDSSASVSGPYTVVVSAIDGNGGTASGTFIWNVANPGPLAVNDLFSTTEDVAFSDSVAGNDSDPDGDGLTFGLLSGPSDGTLVFNSDGTFSYNPNPGFNGTDSFDYELVDSDGTTATATAFIGVGAVNDLPTVVSPINDQANFDSDLISLDVSGTFIDPDGDTLAYSATGLPPGLAIDPLTGVIGGRIDSGASSGGPYSVTVTVDDGNGGTISDTFDWTVTNPAPLAANDSFTTNEDAVLSGSVAGNDTDPDGDTTNFVLLGGPSNGVVSWNSDGTFTYTPDSDFYGLDSFDYQVLDSDGGIATATATISIVPVNDAPVAVDDSATTNEDTSVDIDVLPNDNDPEGGPLTVSVSSAPSHGTVSVNPDGSIRYTPSHDYFGLDSFDYEICDADGLCSIASVNITVVGINDGPVAIDDSFMTDEDTPVIGTVASNDHDPEGDPLSYSLLTPPANGSMTFYSDGTFAFHPDPNFHGVTMFDYEVCDSSGACDTATVIILVNLANDPPVASDDAGFTDEDAALMVDLVGNDSDPEGDPLVVLEINGISMLPGDTVALPSGSEVTLNADGTADYDPGGQFENLATGETAIDSFLYTISDGHGGTATAEAVITISGQNDVPIAEDDFVATTVNTPITFDPLTNDTEVEGQPLAVILLNNPAEGTAVVNTNGTITFTPNPGFEGTVTIHYLVEDPEGASDDATITIEVTPEFRFDSFTNFSNTESPYTSSDFSHENRHDNLLSREIFTLAPEPIFSGYARPGTQVVGRIYDSSGSLVGDSSAITDPGGNWMMQFHSAKGHDFYRIEFEQVTIGVADVYGYLGLNPADNSYQSMEPMTAYDRPLSIEAALRTSEMTLQELHQYHNSPQGLGQ